jgi:transcriptional regulator with XRE-family HTH domain
MKYGASDGGAPQLVVWTGLWPVSLITEMGEAEQQARFARALQEAMEARGKSTRALAIAMQVDPRRVAAWLKGKSLPNLYEAAVLARALEVDEELFRNPPPVPPPPPKPYYPIDQYLLPRTADVASAVESGQEEGVRRLRSRAPGAGTRPARLPAPRARAG